MAMPSLMAARWVSHNSSAIFLHLWTEVHRIKFACAGVSIVCNAVFQLTMSCSFRRYRDEVAKLCEITARFWCF